MPTRRMFRWAALSLLIVASVPALYVGYDQLWIHNLGTVETGRTYRSAQMRAGALKSTIADLKIKTVLNLRGVNPKQPWYRDERRTTTAAGATQIDMSLSSCEWMSRVQLREVVRVLDSCEYPLLVHCQWGSERTGWVSAIATLLRPGATLDEAKNQFSLAYLFARYGDGQVMAEHLDQYEAWLQKQGRSHTPATFRGWVDRGYQPGTPNREQWPFDPYPLVVITRPEPGGTVAEVGTSSQGVKR